MPRQHSKKSLWKQENGQGQSGVGNMPMPPMFPPAHTPFMGSGMQQSIPPYVRPMGSPSINVRTQLVDQYDPNNVEYARTIVQPIAIVPYNTEEQPLLQYPGASDEEVDEDYNNTKEKKFNVLRLFTLIFCLLTIAVLILGKFLKMENIQKFILVQSGKSGYDIIVGIASVFGAGLQFTDMLPVILLTLGALFTLILALISIFGIKRKTKVFSKIIAALMAICFIAFVILAAAVQKNIEIGGYVITGCSLIAAIFTLSAKK